MVTSILSFSPPCFLKRGKTNEEEGQVQRCRCFEVGPSFSSPFTKVKRQKGVSILVEVV